MAKKKGGILSLIPLAIALLLLAGGLFWLITTLIMLLCGLEINPIMWIISGSTAFVGATVLVILLIIGKKKKDE